MAEILGEYARTSEALERPTLSLLGRTWAPVVLSVFACTFPRDVESVPAETFHAQVAALLAELAGSGVDVPADNARALARRWVGQQWLILAPTEDGQETYALTSHAREALDFVGRMSTQRAMISKSRIQTLLDTARRTATEVNPDPRERVARLNAQIAELVAQRDAIAAGERPATLSDDQVIEAFLNIRDLINALPTDFMRVSESVKAIHRQLVEDFRADTRPAGEVLDSYLQASENLGSASAEGRAFQGAVQLLRDDRLLADLREDLATILVHPFSQTLLASEQAEFRGTVSAIGRAINVVLEQRRRLSASLRAQVSRHDAQAERELDAALREAKLAAASWMATASPRAKVPLGEQLGRVDVGHLRQKMYDPGDHRAPEPLETDDNDRDGATTLEALRSQGGPRLRALAERIDAALAASEDQPVTAAAVFATSEVGLRRPVEILGYLDLAERRGGAGTDTPDTFVAVRPDGSTRVFTTARVTFFPPDPSAGPPEQADQHVEDTTAEVPKGPRS